MKRIHLSTALLALLLLPSVLLAGEAGKTSKPNAAKSDPALQPVADVPGLPRVLLLGDSISIGYTLPVRQALQGKANVHRPRANCSSTGYALANLTSWLGESKWDVIHFNFGLHDAKLPPEGIRHASPDVYEKNLGELVARLKATGAKLIWASTTPVPCGGVLAPNRRFGSVDQYNEIAKKIMTQNGVAIDDLNAAARPQMDDILIHRTDARGQVHWDLHYTAKGYDLLARQVTASIEQALARP